MTEKKVKKHIKVYVNDVILNKIQARAKEEGLSQSAWLLSQANKGLKK